MPRTNSDGSSKAIAIIGLSCRFPGDASTPSKFWGLLKNGRDGFQETTDRYSAEAFYHPIGNGSRQNVIPSKGGYFLKQNPYVFDAAFFNITAAEAMAMDPRQRIAMEVAYEAVENAGFTLQKISGTQTACFMGASISDYRDHVARDFAHFPKYHLLGLSDEMISNRISHFLNIHGPSATIQTACSSSLTAIHLACQSLRSGESDMAIAGGVGLLIGTDGAMHLNNLGFLDPAGHSRSFDQDAAGYGRGEGCGILVLKWLDAAHRDGNNIRAVIRGSGVNSDGWTPGVTMPSIDAQVALIKHVYESNGLDYGLTQYVEAHGTGTKAGDPAEASAIYRTIGQATKSSSRKKLHIGSVKPNIGHLEAAAGAASMIKSVLALEAGLIPPNIRFATANSAIPLDEWNMAIPTRLTPWPAAAKKRVSVSGFGMGGTNAHIVLEAAKNASNKSMTASRTSKKRLFVFSSHDRAGFSRMGKSLVDHLDALGSAASSSSYLADLAYTLAVARSGLLWRRTCLAGHVADLREQLSIAVGEDATRTPTSPPRIGFVFTGQGAQWPGMGMEMLKRPVFHKSVTRSATFLAALGADWDPITELCRGKNESRLGVPEISQPICTVLQIALVDELRSWGVVPSKVVGHSSGEIAAAYTVGALSHYDALVTAYFRGVASARVRTIQNKGGMMAVGCSRDEAQKLMDETKLQVTVACVNSPANVTLSGSAATLEALRAILGDRGIFARRLQVDVAYHSPQMYLCSAEYYDSIARLWQPKAEQVVQEPAIIMVSSVTGTAIGCERLVPYYWLQNLISPVLFADALEQLVSPLKPNEAKAIDLLIEIGPHSALGGPTQQTLTSHGIDEVVYQSVLTRGQSALDTSLSLAADLFELGVPIDVSAANGDFDCHLLIDLPPYAWNHSEQFRADSRIQREAAFQQFPTKSLLGALMPRMDESERVWRSFIRLNDEPWLRGHLVGTTVLFPGAGMISVVLEAAQQVVDKHKTASTFNLRDISFLTAMALYEDLTTEITVHMRPHLLGTSGSTPSAWWEFTVSSCVGPDGQLRDNCRGLVRIIYEETRSRNMMQEDAHIEATHLVDYHRVQEECPGTCADDLFYRRLAESALPYGEAFQGVKNCQPGVGQTCYDVEILDIGETFTKGKLERPFLIHAATLDAILHGWVGSTCGDTSNYNNFGTDKPMLPSAIGEMEISADLSGNVGYLMRGVCHSYRRSFNEFSASITMFDPDVTKVLLTITDFRTSQLEMGDADIMDSKSGVDPTEISSEVHWDYTLDLMEPAGMIQVLLDAGAITSRGKFEKLLRLAIHQRPALKIIELVPSFSELRNAVLSTISKDHLLTHQVHYAVLDDDRSNNPDIDKVGDVFGQPLLLRDVDVRFPAGIAPADLFLIPSSISDNLKDGLHDILARVSRMARPDAVLIIVAIASTIEEIASPILKVRGFEIAFRLPTGVEEVVVYRNVSRDHGLGAGDLTNGTLVNGSTHSMEVCIIEPMSLSPDAQTVSQKLQDRLEDQGFSVVIKTGAADIDVFDCRMFISLLELEEPILKDLSEPPFQSIRRLVINSERLLWITCGDDPAFGIIDGLSRCVNNEVAGSKFQVLHLSSGGMQHAPNLALRILKSSTSSADNEFREQDGLLQVQRIYRSTKEDCQIRSHFEDSISVVSINDDSTRFQLTVGKPGLLDSLHFVREEGVLNLPLAEHELELQVRATGVNFRDIMTSMGLIPGTQLGYEASGIVVRAGKRAAEKFQPGDRVSALSTGGMHATKIRCDSRVTAKLPNTMPFEVGAAVPIVHATAYYALVRLAKLRPGHSVLIHAAAGGVGQAALQLAMHLGLRIYATVGTDDKRQFLVKQYNIPEEHIFNSRDSSFAKAVLRITRGHGVDCVLNSLSGELLRVSWNCLASCGTFIEIGFRDITDNMRLDMRPFTSGTTFTFLNLLTIAENEPEILGFVLDEVFKLLHDGVLHAPYPVAVYPVGEMENAFRLMQQGKHRGKIVLSFSEEHKAKAPVLHKANDSLKLDANATYLIVGGLGGLGRSLAKEFVASGARNLAFISRSGDTNAEARALVIDLAAQGARVKVFCADVADQDSFLAAMNQCAQQLPPVKGVIQMAMVLRDTILENMSYEDWTMPLRPKVQGTWNIHQYFDHTRVLDFMIFASSISGICGSRGQAQYDAGNTYQDSMAHYRRKLGLKAVSVDLGIVLDVGVMAGSASHNFKVWEETLGMREPAFCALMKSLINGQMGKRADWCPAQVCVGLGTADLMAAHHLPSPPWFSDPRFASLTTTHALSSTILDGTNATAAAGTAALTSLLMEAGNNKDQAAAARIITAALVGKTAEILRIPKSEVDPCRPLHSYGVDSLVALEVRNWILRELKANIAVLDIMAAVPLKTFAAEIAKKSKLVIGL